ncbi:hypothetical protein BSL78_25409 [Apostichopus japonicus]|uniref:Leucine-rich repeat-containing protein 51 n=1 Tax=Stichopus japonicus TaxID=307972 RepID=A0A2G8JPY1_STIJA|nr:hypothetical protein BSL78_25409 [Apostichopus japonicus]
MTMKPTSEDICPSIDARNEYGPPLDFSFKSLTSFTDVQDENPREGKKKVKKTGEGKICTTAIKFNNNTLTDLNGLSDIIANMLFQPEVLSSVDLSFNDISKIGMEICSYPSIKFLYLHGNGIYQVQEVDKLTSLTNLQDLTLHGNPIVEEGGYRQYVLSKLPGLKNLDFSVVTKADRNDAITWGKMYGKRRRGKKKKSQEDG